MIFFDFSSLQQSSMPGKSAIYVDYFQLFPASFTEGIFQPMFDGGLPPHWMEYDGIMGLRAEGKKCYGYYLKIEVLCIYEN